MLSYLPSLMNNNQFLIIFDQFNLKFDMQLPETGITKYNALNLDEFLIILNIVKSI